MNLPHSPITVDDLKNLEYNHAVYVPRVGRTPERWKVNGQVKVWKRDASRVRVPVKHGLYSYDYITEHELPYLNARGAYIDRA